MIEKSSDQNHESVKGKQKKYMILRLGNSIFAVTLSAVREVLGVGQISSLPNMPSYFAGLINLRGKIISAVYLHKSLNFVTAQDSNAANKRPCVVITEIQGRLFGAIVDDVKEVQAVSEAEIDFSVDGLEGKDVFLGILKREGQTIAPILNLEKALRVKELLAFDGKRAG